MQGVQREKAKVESPQSVKVASARPDGPFKALGLQGFKELAPVLLAALATEEPLLLIGPHGTAKTLLLTRVAAALGLTTRHYNASLLNFDDLVGFPLPGKNGCLEYVKTPAAIWGAGAVIFDEISRCRPDIQNKLFPIIHERKVQGLLLDGLRYRWAAMNPPSTDARTTAISDRSRSIPRLRTVLRSLSRCQIGTRSAKPSRSPSYKRKRRRSMPTLFGASSRSLRAHAPCCQPSRSRSQRVSFSVFADCSADKGGPSAAAPSLSLPMMRWATSHVASTAPTICGIEG